MSYIKPHKIWSRLKLSLYMTPATVLALLSFGLAPPVLADGHEVENRQASPESIRQIVSENATMTEDMRAIIEKFPALESSPVSLIDVIMQIDARAGLTEVNAMPDDDLVEIVSESNEVAYISSKGRYLISGVVEDLKIGLNLTAEKERQLNTIFAYEMPWDHVMSRSAAADDMSQINDIIVFTDVDCPYCKQLERILEFAPDISASYFLMPIPSLHPGAVEISYQLQCEPQPLKAMRDYMLKGVMPTAEITQACRDNVDAVMAFSKENRISSTPTIFLKNGKRLIGAPQSIEQLREEIQKM